MTKLKMASGRKLVDPMASVMKDVEDLSSTSSGCGNRPVVNNTNYGHCSKCGNNMPVTKNADHKDIFFCTTCCVAMPCKTGNN